MKTKQWMMSLGMIGVVAYVIHTLLGRLLWPAYNPITTDISSLTAIGAPNRDLLLIFTTIYSIASILFVIQMIISSTKTIRLGWIVSLLMHVVSFVGYSLFPLVGDKTDMNFSNVMHIVVTVFVVMTTISSSFILAIGYIKNKEKIGYFILVMAIIITMAGALNPICMANKWNVLGLVERLVIYSLQLMMFVVSSYFTNKIN